MIKQWENNLNRYLIKKKKQVAISIWIDAPYHTAPGKCKFKQRYTITHLLQWSKFRKLTTSNADEGVEWKDLIFIVGGNAKLYNHFGRQFGCFLQHDPAIVFFCVYTEELKTHVHTKTCTGMFAAALFISAKNWK